MINGLPIAGRRFAMYVAVAVLAFVAHYGILIAAVRGLDWNPVAASAIGFVCGGIVSYVLNYRITFRSQRRHAGAVSTFLVVVVVGLGFNTLLMSLFVDILDVHYLLAQLITTGLVLLWHFFAHQRWTFGIA